MRPENEWYRDEGDELWHNDYLDATVEPPSVPATGFLWSLWTQVGGWSYENPPDWDVYAEGVEETLEAAQKAAEMQFQITEQANREAEEAMFRDWKEYEDGEMRSRSQKTD